MKSGPCHTLMIFFVYINATRIKRSFQKGETIFASLLFQGHGCENQKKVTPMIQAIIYDKMLELYFAVLKIIKKTVYDLVNIFVSGPILALQ